MISSVDIRKWFFFLPFRYDADTRRTMKEISDNLRRLPQSDPVSQTGSTALLGAPPIRMDCHLLVTHSQLLFTEI